MIIAITNITGGVGKSTLAVHTAVWLSEQGGRVAFIDAEAHQQSRWIQKAAAKIPYYSISSADELSRRVPSLAAEFDDVVIDGPTGLVSARHEVCFLCDLLLLPCSSSLDLDGTKQILGHLKSIQEVRGGAPSAILIPNHIRSGDEDRGFLETVKSLGVVIAPAVHSRKEYAEAKTKETVVWRLCSAAPDKASSEMQTLLGTLFSERNKSSSSPPDLIH